MGKRRQSNGQSNGQNSRKRERNQRAEQRAEQQKEQRVEQQKEREREGKCACSHIPPYLPTSPPSSHPHRSHSHTASPQPTHPRNTLEVRPYAIFRSASGMPRDEWRRSGPLPGCAHVPSSSRRHWAGASGVAGARCAGGHGWAMGVRSDCVACWGGPWCLWDSRVRCVWSCTV